MPILETAAIAAEVAATTAEAAAEVAAEVAKTTVEVAETTAEGLKEIAAKSAETIGNIADSSVEIAEKLSADAKEISSKSIESVGKAKDAVIGKLSDIKSLSPEQLLEQMDNNLSDAISENKTDTDEGTSYKEGLTDDEKQRIKEETGWSDEIIDSIGSWEEYEIYKNAGLVEQEVNGRPCLVRNDIDWDQKDAYGETNRERVEKDKSPLDKDGNPIELHHIGQHADSPLAELTIDEHRGPGNKAILHNKTKDSEINRNAFQTERKQHWKARIEQN